MRAAGWVALAVGVVLVLLFFFASQLGLGGSNLTGPIHLADLVVGIVLIAGGAYYALGTRKGPV